MRARSQQNAEKIYDMVAGIRSLDRSKQKRYGALCHRFPLVVRENGLAAAFGFLAAKGSDNTPENHLLAHYAALLDAQSLDALLKTVINSDLMDYRRLTYRTMAAAEWFKRYAEGVLHVDVAGDDKDAEKHSDD